ncbi:ATP-binding protein [Chitinophaga sp. MM2321]|uniref:sensor histidine kinase n=1 Tax=Chitinophaga sp. MM2321 TaxID=3137178 RepID=UPI0032D58402
MKLRTKYLLFVILLHLVTLVLSFFIFKESKLLFIASEVIVIFSLWVSWSLYRELIKPLKFLLQGVDAIKERDFNVRFVPTGKYEMDLLIDVYNQMIDQLRTERTKQEQQHLFLEKLIYTSPTGIIILDYDDIIRQVNPTALQLLGGEEKMLTGQLISDLDHPVLQQIIKLKSGESVTITLNGINTYKLQKSHFIDRGFSRHFIMIEELTAEILAAEKKAYGKVIRMMAHEVNNTIGPVNSILQAVLKSQEQVAGNDDQLLQNTLQVAIDRNYNLNSFMRNFADVVRLPEPVRREIDLRRLVLHVGQLMEMKAGEKEIHFEFEVPEWPFFIYADQQQMEQVLINIIRNGMEAITHNGSILFTINQQHKELVITDSGHGIAASVADQLFSPFFSTKKDGQGIGLTLVKEILLNHGFEFSLKTPAGGNTAFIIRF